MTDAAGWTMPRAIHRPSHLHPAGNHRHLTAAQPSSTPSTSTGCLLGSEPLVCGTKDLEEIVALRVRA